MTRTTIGSLGLRTGDVFGYWFDFGAEKARRWNYPKVTKRVGASPPQYVDWDTEDDE